MMTARDPYVNVMRGAIAAFSAGLGGADSVSVLPHTLAVGLPDSLARRLARNGQLILLRESNLGFVADPAAGAGAFEALTKALVRQGLGALPGDRRPRAACRRRWRAARFSVRSPRAPPRSGATSRGSSRRSPASAPIPIWARRRSSSRRARPTAKSPPPPRARSRRCGSPSRSSLARPVRRGAAKTRRAAEGLSRRARARARASPPRRLHARMARGGRHRAGLRRRIGDARRGGRDGSRRAARRSPASAATTRLTRRMAEAFARAVKAAGVKGLMPRRAPGRGRSALRAAGVDDFIFAGGDAIAALHGLYRRACGLKRARKSP